MNRKKVVAGFLSATRNQISQMTTSPRIYVRDNSRSCHDLSISTDLALDEMELAATCDRLDFDSDDDPWDHVQDAIESIAARLGFGLGGPTLVVTLEPCMMCAGRNRVVLNKY
jgi:hypothetical protein